jgi:hypothetical protein
MKTPVRAHTRKMNLKNPALKHAESPRWKKLSNNQYELITPQFDLYAVKNSGEWGVDVFNHQIKNKDEAYIESFNADSLEDAKKQAEDYR